MRKYKTELGSLDEAVNRAVDECIRNDVLADFLRKNRAEVEMTSIFEYNQEEEERKLRAAERQAGYDVGYERGAAEGEVRSTVNAVIKLMQNMKLTMEQALDTLDITGDEREEVLERLNKKMNV